MRRYNRSMIMRMFRRINSSRRKQFYNQTVCEGCKLYKYRVDEHFTDYEQTCHKMTTKQVYQTLKRKCKYSSEIKRIDRQLKEPFDSYFSNLVRGIAKKAAEQCAMNLLTPVIGRTE